jgi:hypothetical protein
MSGQSIPFTVDERPPSAKGAEATVPEIPIECDTVGWRSSRHSSGAESHRQRSAVSAHSEELLLEDDRPVHTRKAVSVLIAIDALPKLTEMSEFSRFMIVDATTVSLRTSITLHFLLCPMKC